MRFHTEFDKNFLSKSNTTAVKGIFVVLVFIAHILQYIVLGNNVSDKLLDFVMGVLGQNIVVVFFLYSGYGIGEAIKKKDDVYISTIPRKRILTTWIQFVCAVFLYWIMDICVLHEGYGVKEYFFSLFAWESIGNSTWFVFAIIICWGATWLAFVSFNKRNVAFVALCTILVVYICLIKEVQSGHAWYDTILCFPLGVAVAFWKEKMEKILSSSLKTTIMILFTGTWLLIRIFAEKNVFVYEIQSLLFALFVLAVSSRVTVNNKILRWLGEHSFGIYILQRLPMNLLAHYHINSEHLVVYVGGCVGATIVLAYLFNKVMPVLTKKLCEGKKT